ncbi:RagB/SusD family nutrient uptake outer membrane protein [Dysgonomonas sp. Marseille-P4677]|uniref:RagB/SusD family nutrient uptake outer membrane protein n=1 Tax=Dysgonomonas sp. Marseille-P4677 TaxID=2364790 RepID=UPI0019147904|nr:RagB/SusD family nutrient uptake outer membrane protein [Dysgonomonas sp. Marseille-P4677]MBK5720729.1 RagB/SusD family nutrient uptake outer membrane protein [Dysgonomonas sp. Marseille-P4677]
MKKLYIILSFLFAGIYLTSCDDRLDMESPDQLTSSNFWRNQADAESGLAAAYSKLECATETWEFAEVKFPVEAYREDLCNIGSDALNYPTWVDLYNFTYTNGNSQFSMYWEITYRGISHTNQVLAKVPDINMNTEYKNQILAEAHFLRAYYHMKLLLNWEKIIIRDEYITKEEQISKPLSDRSEVWDFIVNEYEEAVKHLPLQQTPEHIGRATKGAAYAYLGYSYLTRAYEETAKKNEYLNNAETAFKSVKGYELEAKFLSMFDGTNKNSKESIFELQFTDNTSNGAAYRTALHKWIATGEIGGWDEISPNQILIDEFKKEGKIATTGLYDSRLYQTVFFNDPYFNDPSTNMVYGSTYNERFGAGSDKAAFRKYIPATWEDMQKSRTAVNLPLMRYADVLLLLAETLNEQGKAGEAIPLINKVRARADMPEIPANSTQEFVKKQIEHERILEFALENTRFYDLRRWGKTKEALTAVGRSGFNPEKHNFYPIPLLEIKSNDLVN